MVAATKYPRKNIRKAVQCPYECHSSTDDLNPVQNLDELCSAMTWTANTGAIFALEKIDLPLVDTSIALEAAGGDVLMLVKEMNGNMFIMKYSLIPTFATL
jgi:hypothetical protein